MRIGLAIFMSLSILISQNAHADDLDLASPNGRNEIRFTLVEGIPHFTLLRDEQVIIAPSPLGLRFLARASVKDDFQVVTQHRQAMDETWAPVWGESDSIRNHYRELRVELLAVNSPRYFLNLEFRAYDDGVAFRYALPPESENPDFMDLSYFEIISESTRFRFTGNHDSWSIPADFDSYEHVYRELPLDELDAANTPLTLRTAAGVYISLHEANLTDWAAMTLARVREEPFTLECDLVPWPDGVKVRGGAPASSPWRTIQIADRPGDLVESNLILNLNEPCALEDTSWIRPMKYAGIWWSLHIGKHSWHMGPKHGATTDMARRYVDFAAAHGLDALLIEGWNTGWDRWGAKDAYDFVTPYPDFDLEAVTRYGAERGVAIIGHHETGGDVPSYEARLDSAFALYARVGVPAVKTGYAGGIYPRGQHHHGQWMVRHYRRVVQKAAQYRIMLDVHEPIKDTGLSRTWPNMMTREGVRGMEYNAWSEGNPPEHETILPFTRMLAGPADFTPGIFDTRFDAYKPNNLVRSTLARQLALYVLLFSPLQMAADLPENYEGHPAFAFIRAVPASWDETRGLEAVIGDHAAIARRKGEEWYLGCVTDENARRVDLPLDFLPPGRLYRAELYLDGPEADWERNPGDTVITEKFVDAGEILTIDLARGGGAALRLVPAP